MEQDEQQQFVASQIQKQIDERFEKEKDRFIEEVVMPVFQEIADEFYRVGRTVRITPPLQWPSTMGWIRLDVRIPDGRTMSYQIRVEQNMSRLVVMQFAAISARGQQVEKELGKPYKTDLIDGITKKHIQQNFFEQYNRLISSYEKMNN